MVHMSSLLFLLVALALAPAGAFSIDGRVLLPRTSTLTLPKATKVLLNAGELTGIVRSDGAFTLHGVAAGVHRLEVLAPDFQFSSFKLDVSKDTGKVRVLEFAYPGAAKQAASYPIVATAHGKVAYFQKREGFNYKSILYNPMIIMMLVTGVLVFAMPKMMQNMDPEEMKQMQEQMRKQQDPKEMMSSLFGGGEAEDSDDE